MPTKLSRRTVLRGAGHAAIALPFLEAMLPRNRSWAAETTQKRFIVYYTPGGTVLDDWRPKGTETAFTFNTILSPLEPVKQKLVVIDGLDLKVTGDPANHGHPHSRGMGGVLTGQPLLEGPYETCAGKAGYAAGPSIDQVIAKQIGAGTKIPSLEVAVNWPTDRRDGGKAAPTNCINYAGRNQGIPMEVDPKRVWDRLFKDFGAGTDALAAQKLREKSILDAVLGEYKTLAARVSPSDKLKLDEHLAKIDDIQKGLTASDGSGTTAACSRPEPPMALGNTSVGNEGSAGSNDQSNSYIDPRMPALGKSMMDMLVMGLTCGLTRVGTMQWADSQSYNTFPWLGLNENHHAYQHDHGYQPEAIKKINNWYMKQLLYFLQELDKVKEGDRTLLDNSAVLVVSEISHPNSHGQDDMPFMLAGSAGGAFKTGRYVRYNSLPHNNLLVNVANAYGIQSNTFGKPDHCTGRLANL